MNGDRGGDRLSLIDRRLPSLFSLKETIMAPGEVRPYDDFEWCDALVVIERGAIELVSVHGSRRRLEEGAVLWLSGLPLRELHNPKSEPVVLVAVTRRAQRFR
jgi:hypothetical protein